MLASLVQSQAAPARGRYNPGWRCFLIYIQSQRDGSQTGEIMMITTKPGMNDWMKKHAEDGSGHVEQAADGTLFYVGITPDELSQLNAAIPDGNPEGVRFWYDYDGPSDGNGHRYRIERRRHDCYADFGAMLTALVTGVP